MRTIDDVITDLSRPQTTRDLRDIVRELAERTKLIEESTGIYPVLLSREPTTATEEERLA